MQFSVIRLGRDSVSDIQRINSISGIGSPPETIQFTCKQVEDSINAGDYCFICLGSDNDKGQPTQWKQGLRCIGRITQLDKGKGFNDPSTFSITLLVLLQDSLDQFDFLEKASSFYKYFAAYPVLGVRSYRNNAIQKVHEGTRINTSALLTAVKTIFPDIETQIAEHANELLPLLNFSPLSNSTEDAGNDEYSSELFSSIETDIFQRGYRNFLFLGPPGTGKTWHAQQIAKKLTNYDGNRHSFVQFHPSFSYDDFMEGYIPLATGQQGGLNFELKKKHLLKMCEQAKSADQNELYVLVVDEMTRGDTNRILGEAFTYLEPSYRNQEFSLSYSGDTAVIPSNLVLIATANPYDRSVGEIDDAFIRRFIVREFPPDIQALEARLIENLVSNDLKARILRSFELINQHLPDGFGHAHFWNIKTSDDFLNLWSTRVKFILRRALKFEEERLDQLSDEIDELFNVQQVADTSLEEVSESLSKN